MVPWSIALLTLLYGVIATAAAVSVWKMMMSGVIHQPFVWPMIWLVLSGGAMCGLPLAKFWGRTLALCTSWLLLVVMLAIAGKLILSHHPVAALLTACLAGSHVVILRYLQRPAVKTYFGFRNADFG